MIARQPSAPPAPSASPASRADVDNLLVSHLPLVRWLAHRNYAARDCQRAAVDTDDLAQDLVLRVLKSFKRFDPTRASFSTWLSWMARRTAQSVRNHVQDTQGNVSTVHAGGGTEGQEAPERERGRAADLLARIADRRTVDPARGAALLRVLVPVEDLAGIAVPVAWVRDQRSNRRVQVPAADVVEWRGRLFAVAVSYDEGEDADGEQVLHRVRFGNDATAWVLAGLLASRDAATPPQPAWPSRRSCR